MATADFQLVEELGYPVWVGNLGKSSSVNSILTWSQSSSLPAKSTRILDLGAGRGNEWLNVLSHDESVEVTLWDPDPRHLDAGSSQESGQRLTRVESPNDIRAAGFDFVTSFSVLENVADLVDHFKLMQNALKPGGWGIVLWDAGHFRPSLDLRRPVVTGTLALKESPKWGASAALGGRVPPSHFQRPRSVRDARAAAKDAGLHVVYVTLCGLPGVKHAAHMIDEGQRLPTLNSWLYLERQVLGQDSLPDEQLLRWDEHFDSRLLLVRK